MTEYAMKKRHDQQARRSEPMGELTLEDIERWRCGLLDSLETQINAFCDTARTHIAGERRTPKIKPFYCCPSCHQFFDDDGPIASPKHPTTASPGEQDTSTLGQQTARWVDRDTLSVEWIENPCVPATASPGDEELARELISWFKGTNSDLGERAASRLRSLADEKAESEHGEKWKALADSYAANVQLNERIAELEEALSEIADALEDQTMTPEAHMKRVALDARRALHPDTEGEAK